VSHEVTGPVFEFGDFRLDCGRFELVRNGKSLRVERKPMELLILLVTRQGQLVTRAEIAQRLWSSEVFVDTEHGINTAIRKLRYLLRDDSEEPKFIQTVTGMGYRFVARTISVGNPATAPPDAPALEPAASDPGLVAETLAPPTVEESRKKSLAVQIFVFARFIALTVLFIVMAIGPRQIAGLLHRDSNPPITSLAVIPLDNLSGDPSQEYFADGMTDELITMLAKDSTLRITSRTSVMQYKGAHRPLQEIARALNVDGILEGSISRTNSNVHLNLQLIRADTDAHVWAESYDRNVSDTALPNEAALAIAKRLGSVSASSAHVRYVNPAAHDAFLRGKYLWFTDRMQESGEHFKKATEIQPDYAEAWAWLSAYYGEGIVVNALEPRTSLQPMWETAQRALQLDPDLADSHWAMGGAFFLSRWDWANADREFQRAISMDPRNAEYYYVRADLLQALNRNDEAIASAKKAMELDPFARPYGLASIYIGARQYDAALADVQLRMEASPNNPDLWAQVFDARRRKGDYKQAIEAWAKWHILTGDPQSAVNLRRAYEKGGARGFIQWQLDRRLLQSKTQYVSPGELADDYAQLGERDKTLVLLEDAYSRHFIDVIFIQGDPAFDFLHKDPRYRSLVQRMHLPPAY
jgi:TolB-like protein/DNA-binding winged helix-turn-helix (wHTH) protein